MHYGSFLHSKIKQGLKPLAFAERGSAFCSVKRSSSQGVLEGHSGHGAVKCCDVIPPNDTHRLTSSRAARLITVAEVVIKASWLGFHCQC